MVELARLESVCGSNVTRGSNPRLSAINEKAYGHRRLFHLCKVHSNPEKLQSNLGFGGVSEVEKVCTFFHKRAEEGKARYPRHY